MPIDENVIVILFLCSISVAQYVLYSTIVMVYFKQKIRMCKSDPLYIVKSRIESPIKAGIGE